MSGYQVDTDDVSSTSGSGGGYYGYGGSTSGGSVYYGMSGATVRNRGTMTIREADEDGGERDDGEWVIGGISLFVRIICYLLLIILHDRALRV